MPRKVYISIALKKEIYKLAGGCCEYCKKYSSSPFAIEHIIPISLNGSHLIENLAYSCGGCNQHKHAATESLDPITNQTVSLFHPRKHQWNDHFRWSDDLLEMIGVTPIGRSTIGRLKTNRKELVNLRSLTILTKEHPPV